MNLAILHYHLNRGGVTRVIENQLAALDAVLGPDETWRVAVIHGGRCEGWNEELPERLRRVRLSLVETPLLDYDEVQPRGGRHGPAEVLMELYAALGRLDFQPQQTVLHVHNHSLGKNGRLAEVLPVLAEDGYALLLQIHDFAEDFRPDGYRRIAGVADAGPYPQAENIHYAVLNGRDHAIMEEAGTQPGRLHLLPNPVPEMDGLPSKSHARGRLAELFDVDPAGRLLLYPVRGIRRKNLGEALLYSALAPPGTVVGMTLGPLSPTEVPIYQRWKELAGELRLPCLFELGEPGRLSFAENLAAADAILTTSLAEGFGMVFLESWLAGRPLLGRDLPEITPDFTREGVRFDWLRPQLEVPLEWVGAERFCRRVAEAYGRTLQKYNRPQPPDVAEQLRAKTEAGLVDFGDLDEPMQRQVIETVCRSRQNRRRVLDCNRWLEEAFGVKAEGASEVIDHNARAIRRHFSLLPGGRRLLELYARVAASPRDEVPQALPYTGRILDRFLNLARYRPIRS